jgi:thiosulfate reductase cytochrome b subunit
MSSAFPAVWRTIVGLVVEDSQLAIGILAALAITWLLGSAVESVHDIVGWLLLAMLILVLMLNLVVTARRAKRRIA